MSSKSKIRGRKPLSDGTTACEGDMDLALDTFDLQYAGSGLVL